MKSFAQYISEENLQEKQIIINNGAAYGQIVFLIGGGGSGKGFALQNFLEKSKFKVRDVDEMKIAFLKLDDILHKVKKLPDCKGDEWKDQKPLKCNPLSSIRGLDLRNPRHVFALHSFVDEMGTKDKTLDFLLSGAKTGHLPNILFDMTGKNVQSIQKVISQVTSIGYQTHDIHLIWVLANYAVAVERNSKRSRVVPDDILLNTHEGAVNTMHSILQGNIPSGVDGGIYVILNRDLKVHPDPSQSDYYADGKTIKNFDYIQAKKPGKAMSSNAEWKSKVHQWVIDNAPKTDKTSHIWKK